MIHVSFVSDPTAQFCFPDQVLNIHSFSMLRSWLQHFTFASSTAPSPRSDHSPLISATASQSGSVENLSQSIQFSDSPSGHRTLDQSQSSMDNISIDSQSSTGFITPLSRSSPQESGAHSFSQSPSLGQLTDRVDKDSSSNDSGSRPQTPLTFPLDPEEISTKVQTQAAAKQLRHQRSHSTLSFSKLFPSSLHGAKTGEQELKERSCEYCLRLLEQSERSKFPKQHFPLQCIKPKHISCQYLTRHIRPN